MTRPPPRHIEILIPAWGERSRRQLLDNCLPSLLAPGNIPAIAQLAPCTLVLLSTRRDAAEIERSAVWNRLQAICRTRFEPIDDLISGSSATVLTLAYALAIRAAGAQMLETCFLLLVADYVIADGSLRNVAGRIFAGASGVLAGNFQAAAETLDPQLSAAKAGTGSIAIPASALVEMSLSAMHEASRACVVGRAESHDTEANRLFWPLDGRTMLAHFYLMHMIAIRPETPDFVIGAPSDYCLVSELCPSGAVVRITDSDEYFAVECQPAGGSPRLSPGALTPSTMAAGVSRWATREHRANARHPVLFHGGDAAPNVGHIRAVAESFVSEVERLAGDSTRPSRGHPQWQRMLDRHCATARVDQDPRRLAAITGDTSLLSGLARPDRTRRRLLGRAPRVRAWHPRWPDLRQLRRELAAVARGKSLLIVGEFPQSARRWLGDCATSAGARSVAFVSEEETGTGPTGAQPHDAGLVFCRDPQLGDSVFAAARVVKPGGALLLAIGDVFADAADALQGMPPIPPGDASLALEHTRCVVRRRSRHAVQDAMMRHAREAVRSGMPKGLFSGTAAAGLAAISMLCNVFGTGAASNDGRSAVTSMFLCYRRTAGTAASSPVFRTGRVVPDRQLRLENVLP